MLRWLARLLGLRLEPETPLLLTWPERPVSSSRRRRRGTFDPSKRHCILVRVARGGTRIALIDQQGYGYDWPHQPSRWVLRCESHGYLTSFRRKAEAEEALDWPNAWCPECGPKEARWTLPPPAMSGRERDRG